MAKRKKNKLKHILQAFLPKLDYGTFKSGKYDASAFLSLLKSEMRNTGYQSNSRFFARLGLFSHSPDNRQIPEEKKVNEGEIDELVSLLKGVKLKTKE